MWHGSQLFLVIVAGLIVGCGNGLVNTSRETSSSNLNQPLTAAKNVKTWSVSARTTTFDMTVPVVGAQAYRLALTIKDPFYPKDPAGWIPIANVRDPNGNIVEVLNFEPGFYNAGSSVTPMMDFYLYSVAPFAGFEPPISPRGVYTYDVSILGGCPIYEAGYAYKCKGEIWHSGTLAGFTF